jgi:hypothetical protein
MAARILDASPALDVPHPSRAVKRRRHEPRPVAAEINSKTKCLWPDKTRTSCPSALKVSRVCRRRQSRQRRWGQWRRSTRRRCDLRGASRWPQPLQSRTLPIPSSAGARALKTVQGSGGVVFQKKTGTTTCPHPPQSVGRDIHRAFLAAQGHQTNDEGPDFTSPSAKRTHRAFCNVTGASEARKDVGSAATHF